MKNQELIEVYMPISREEAKTKTVLRNKRCLLPDGKGGFIRCPEDNICWNCKRCQQDNFTTNSPLSIEKLTQGDSENDVTIDIEGKYESEDDIIARLMLDDLLSYLATFEGKGYDKIFFLLYDQYSTQEIADELGVTWNTAKDAIKRVRQLAQKHTKLSKK